MGERAESQRDPHTVSVLIMGLGFFGIFMAFNTAQALQSSVNHTLGNACLCVLYATFTAACLVGPIVVEKWGPKISMIVGGTTYVAMVLSNLHPSWGLSVPMFFLVGLGAPLLWTGQAVYLSRCANQSAARELAAEGDEVIDDYVQRNGVTRAEAEKELLKDKVKNKQALYNSYFFSFFQANGCLGLAVSTGILLGTSSVDFLFIILSAVCAVGVSILTFGIPNVVAVSFDELLKTNDVEDGDKYTLDDNDAEEAAPTMLETLRFGLTTPRLFMYIPIMLYNGMSLGFFLSDFTRYVIDEAVGNKTAGFVVSGFYAINLGATILTGKSIVKRSTLVLGAGAMHAAFFLCILFLRASLTDASGSDIFANSANEATNDQIKAGLTDELSRWFVNSEDSDHWQHRWGSDNAPIGTWVLLFVLAGLFACGDAVWESQVPAVLGGYFPTGRENCLQAANFKMWQSFGFAAMFGLDVLFPTLGSGDSKYHVNDLFYVKVLLLLGGLVISMVCVWYTHKFVAEGRLDYESASSSKQSRYGAEDSESLEQPLNQQK